MTGHFDDRPFQRDGTVASASLASRFGVNSK